MWFSALQVSRSRTSPAPTSARTNSWPSCALAKSAPASSTKRPVNRGARDIEPLSAEPKCRRENTRPPGGRRKPAPQRIRSVGHSDEVRVTVPAVVVAVGLAARDDGVLFDTEQENVLFSHGYLHFLNPTYPFG